MAISLTERDRFILPDARSLKLHCWKSVPPVRGVLVFAHGMLEHGGRYADWGKAMAENGYTVFAPDQRGHGQSEGQRIWIRQFSDLIDDFQTLTLAVADEFLNQPIFLVGMSMGGGVAIRTAVRVQEQRKNIAGLILVAPALRAHPNLCPRLRPFAFFFDRWLPRWKIVRPGLSGLSRDPSVIEGYRNDPNTENGFFAVHYGVENIRALEGNRSCAEKIRLPILAMQGLGDRITDPNGPIEFIEKVHFADKTLKTYPQLYHDLLHEPEKETVRQDMLDWLDKHC